MDLEQRVLDVLDPPLNLEGRPPTDLRLALSQLRKSIQATSPAKARQTRPIRTTPATARVVPHSPAPRRVTLHDEMAEILREMGGWVAADELASSINRRGNYAKKDGSVVAASQVRLRAYKYSHLFQLDGMRIRLVDQGGGGA